MLKDLEISTLGDFSGLLHGNGSSGQDAVDEQLRSYVAQAISPDRFVPWQGNGHIGKGLVGMIQDAAGQPFHTQTSIDGAPVYINVLDPEGLLDGQLDISAEAHPDDKALGGMDVVSKRPAIYNMGIVPISISFTDGGARNLQGVEPSVLIPARRVESVAEGIVKGAHLVIGFGEKDRALADNIQSATNKLAQVADVFSIAQIHSTHPKDPNRDHRAGAKIARTVALAYDVPLIYMDTPTMKDMSGRNVAPTHFYPLTTNEYSVLLRGYFANWSQTGPHLPLEEYRDVERVAHRTEQRGRSVGVPYAGVGVVDRSTTKIDPFRRVLGSDVYVIGARKPVYYRAKNRIARTG